MVPPCFTEDLGQICSESSEVCADIYKGSQAFGIHMAGFVSLKNNQKTLAGVLFFLGYVKS